MRFLVTKKSGEEEEFSQAKVIRSMKRVGVPEKLWPEVLDHINGKLYNGIPTAEVFTHIKEYLGKRYASGAIKLNLKQAIFDLGPTGFPFERYMERIFQSMNYTTQVDAQLSGECVRHEIDLVVEKDWKKEIIEAKFHNQAGIKTDIHVIMYTYARYLDVKEKNNISGVWVVTNTKLSEDAISYATCKRISVIAWNYPEEGNLQDFVENPHMYPITILHALTAEDKQRLMEDSIILCCDFLRVPDNELESKYLIKRDRIFRAKEGARTVCGDLP